MSAAFCAAPETHLAGVTMERGREQPPGFAACPVPRTTRRVAHAPMSLPRSVAQSARDHPPFAHRLSHAYAFAISCKSHGTSDHINRCLVAPVSAITSSTCGGARLRQGSSLRSAPLRGPPGLDEACAPLEGSTYVMAWEISRLFADKLLDDV